MPRIDLVKQREVAEREGEQCLLWVMSVCMAHLMEIRMVEKGRKERQRQRKN